jgi:protein TonB
MLSEPAANQSAAPSGDVVAVSREDAGLLPVATFILWTACLAIGGVGLGLSYAHAPPQQKKAPELTQAELLFVELTSNPMPELESPPPPDLAQPPPLQPLAPPPPSAPPLLPLAQPNPATAFPLPAPTPARIVEAREASYARVPEQTIPASPAAPTVQPITFGKGEGRQPAPNYPRQAISLGQEGNVMVRMSVGENGRVLAAEASQPSPWPSLNAEAVRVIRERWRFRPGPIRLYEVSIRFELNR